MADTSEKRAGRGTCRALLGGAVALASGLFVSGTFASGPMVSDALASGVGSTDPSVLEPEGLTSASGGVRSSSVALARLDGPLAAVLVDDLLRGGIVTVSL